MEKRVQDYTQDILAVVRSNTSPAAMSDKLGDFHANDIADAMPRLTVQERCKLYRILELDMLSDIFEYTDSDNAAEYVKEMDVKKVQPFFHVWRPMPLWKFFIRLIKPKRNCCSN